MKYLKHFLYAGTAIVVVYLVVIAYVMGSMWSLLAKALP